MSTPAPRIAIGELKGFAARALAVLGLPEGDARTVADAIVRADAAGVASHGVSRLPQYAQALRRGEVNALARPRVERRQGGVALLDADNGMGHLAMVHAVELACDLARGHGVAWVGLRRSNHAGAGGVYVDDLARRGFMAVYGAVSGVNVMAPAGGREPLLGTNPLAIGIPAAGGDPMVFDAATSATSLGKVRAKAAAGQTLPEGWMVDAASGAPLRDPRRAAEGLLLPMAGHKGSGLALALGLMAGALNGAAFGRAVPALDAGSGFGVDTGQFLLALDLGALGPRQAAQQRVQDGLDQVAGSLPTQDNQPVRWPGQLRGHRLQEAARDGIPVDPRTFADLERLAQSCGIAPPRSRTPVSNP
jgi:LDH2 family malate/lactate/ureidoglycolate dehydrogenase